MKYLLSLFLFLTLLSCDSGVIYKEKIDVDANGWNYDNPVSFSFTVSDTMQTYDLVLNIDHDVEFSSQNFYTQFTTTYPDGKEIKDVVSMELSSNYGQWMGDCNDDACLVDILLKGSTRFKQSGEHTIKIAQHTREASLEGIRSLEFQLIKARK